MEIDQLFKKARELSPKAFASEFRCPLLIVPKIDDHSEPFAFQTRSNVLREDVRAQLAAEIGQVVEITKSDRNPFVSRIIVGRTRNCDIVLRHASVSKMHAYFRRSPKGDLEVVDLGARNPTRVNRRELAPNSPAPVPSGSVIQFGDIATQLVEPRALQELLITVGV